MIAAEAAARVIFQAANGHPDGSIILPTGRAGTLLFKAMIRTAGAFAPRPFGDSMVLNDTETFGVHGAHHTSRSRHVRQNLLDRLAAADLGASADQASLWKAS